VKPSIHLNLEQSLSKSGATPLLPIHAFMACTETTLASSLTPKWCKRASKLVSAQAAVPSAVCVSSHCLTDCLTVSLDVSPSLLSLSLSPPPVLLFLCLYLCLTVSVSPPVSHYLCLTVGRIVRNTNYTARPHTVQPSETGPCNDTNCIVCEVATGSSNCITQRLISIAALHSAYFKLTVHYRGLHALELFK
jgi:hypothetical protein